MKIPGECTVCGGQNGSHASWCGHGRRGCGGGRNSGPSFSNGPRSPRDWELAMLDEAQVTFWKLI